MQSITTYTEFKQAVVEPDFRDFMSDQSNLRKAWHSAGSLFHLADWVYVAHKPTIDSKYKFVDDIGRTKFVSCPIEFANSLGQIHPEFQLIRGIANAAKHCELKSVPPGRKNLPGMASLASDTYVSTGGFEFERLSVQRISDCRGEAAREPKGRRVCAASPGGVGYVGQGAVFEAYRELIEEVASAAYDAEAPFDDHGRILVTSEALARITRSA